MSIKKSMIVPYYDSEDGEIYYRYFDKAGNELHEDDFVRWDNGKVQKLYLTEHFELGTDATNPYWIETGRACECEYGIYPLESGDMCEIIKV